MLRFNHIDLIEYLYGLLVLLCIGFLRGHRFLRESVHTDLRGELSRVKMFLKLLHISMHHKLPVTELADFTAPLLAIGVWLWVNSSLFHALSIV